MTPVLETTDGFKPVRGNPTLTSLDGKVRAPLRTILSPSWSEEDRAKFGVYLVEPATIPDGKRAVGSPTYEQRDGKVVEVRAIEDIPTPEPDTRTPEQKVEAMISRFGLTVEELRSVLIGDGSKQ